MKLQYETYNYTPILGWSISRYELFDKCKRQYFYSYYSKFVPGIPLYKIKQLKELTSVPLEVGNVVHDIVETFLRRLQKSDSNINIEKFFDYARTKALEYFSRKTFIEVYYKYRESISIDYALERIESSLRNFITSPCYSWIYMKALTNKDNWMIEPQGYGETRLGGLKAYCKMDFLFPVGNDIYILDWKTGSKNSYKHSQQLIGYAAAASSNFGIAWNKIFPKIVYLYPHFEEFELQLTEKDLLSFYEKVQRETDLMQSCLTNIENNTPKSIDTFPMNPSESLCAYCNYQELCFPDGLAKPSQPAEVDFS